MRTSYRGLFNFIRYIENLQKYDVDYGEAQSLGENGNGPDHEYSPKQKAWNFLWFS